MGYCEGTARNAYNIALGDWFHPPVIDRIQWHAGQVLVGAYDDVRVARVTVAILDLDEGGQHLEQGEAELTMGIWWEYQATHKGRIHVEARDLAGNVTQQEFSPPFELFSVWEKASPGRHG